MKSKTEIEPPRIWMGPAFKRTMLFLEDSGYRYAEHQIQSNGHNKWTTCRPHDCELCRTGHRPHQVALFSVLDYGLNHEKRPEKSIFTTCPAVHQALLNAASKHVGRLRGTLFHIECMSGRPDLDLNVVRLRRINGAAAGITPFYFEKLKFKWPQDEGYEGKSDLQKTRGQKTIQLAESSQPTAVRISDFVEIPEICEFLGTERKLVYALLQANVIPNEKHAGRYRIKCEDFLRWAERNDHALNMFRR